MLVLVFDGVEMLDLRRGSVFGPEVVAIRRRMADALEK